MIINLMFNLIIKSLFLYLLFFNNTFANQDFDLWSIKFQTRAIESGISKKVVHEIMSNAKFLPNIPAPVSPAINFFPDSLHIKAFTTE